jgi:hypothetical protein
MGHPNRVQNTTKSPTRCRGQAPRTQQAYLLVCSLVLSVSCSSLDSKSGTPSWTNSDMGFPDLNVQTDLAPTGDASSQGDLIAAPDVPAADTSTDTESDLAMPAGCPSLAVGPIPDGRWSDFGGFFAKHVDVFGVKIFGSRSVGDPKILHAAGVLAQYLDNDEDCVPDDSQVVQAMIANGAFLAMFFDDREIESSGLFESDILDGFAGQDLYDRETHPEGSSPERGFDATLEEVLHLVTAKGHASVYPNVFGESPGSAIADAMDTARGGRFDSVPQRYPDGAWYHYDDRTCDYRCMVTEYFYWALTAKLNAQNYSGRCEEIAREWELCTPELVRERDPAIWALLSDAANKLPTRLPTGRYRE